MITRLLIGIYFLTFILMPPLSHADEQWYEKELRQAIKENNCQLPAYGNSKKIGYFLQTPEYFVAWCKSNIQKSLENTPCFDSLRTLELTPKEKKAGIVVCIQDYGEFPQDTSFYDLIVITSNKDHEWRACPKIINLAVNGTPRVWIEKDIKPYGEALLLSEFWAANSATEDQHFVMSDAPANGLALLYGYGDGAAQILYCNRNQWVMSGYH